MVVNITLYQNRKSLHKCLKFPKFRVIRKIMDGIEDIFRKSSAMSVEARKRGNRLYARKHHDQNTHKLILSEYTKSIAYASKDSESGELAAAYGNRSALLMHLNEYEKCMLDVERALKLSRTPELTSKLEARRVKCLAAMKVKNLRVSGNKVKCVSDAIVVEYNEKFGRHLVARRHINPGETISVDKGYVCYPIVNKRHTTCGHCLSFTWTGVPCDSCAFVIYCGEACKRRAWEEYHDVECDLLPIVPIEIFTRERFFLPYLMVAARLLIKAVKSEGLDVVVDQFHNSENGEGMDGSSNNTFRACINLQSHKGANSDNQLKYDDSTVSSVIESLCRRTTLLKSQDRGTRTTLQLKAILRKLTNIVDDNVFEYQAFVCECENTFECRMKCDATRGTILAPSSSLINHSCNANVRRMFLPNGNVVMFTVAPVKKGEQLFISYGTLHTEKREYRQTFLRNFFHFTCMCRACEENWPSDPEKAELDEKTEGLIMLKITLDFKKHFPYVRRSSIMNVSEDDWEFDEETLRHAVKLSELTYKHFDNAMLSSYYNDKYRNYISSAFHALYGEKCSVTDKCP